MWNVKKTKQKQKTKLVEKEIWLVVSRDSRAGGEWGKGIGGGGPKGSSDGKESICNAQNLVESLGWKDTLEKGRTTNKSRSLAWRIPWTEEPAGYGPWGAKSQTWVSDFHFH